MSSVSSVPEECWLQDNFGLLKLTFIMLAITPIGNDQIYFINLMHIFIGTTCRLYIVWTNHGHITWHSKPRLIWYACPYSRFAVIQMHKSQQKYIQNRAKYQKQITCWDLEMWWWVLFLCQMTCQQFLWWVQGYSQSLRPSLK